MEKNQEKTRYSGYGYHGGGRRKLSESGRKCLSVSLQQFQIDHIKELAEKLKMNHSAFIYEAVCHYERHLQKDAQN